MRKHFSTVRGFTLVEIMIVVAIIGALAALFTPNWARARRHSQNVGCMNNIRQLSAAVEQWALMQHKPEGTTPEWPDILPYLRGNQKPVCPASGTYGFRVIGDEYPAYCTVLKHNTPFE